MKKKLFVLMLACISVLLITITGCGKHAHTFEEKWTKDATYHWHVATCKHTDEVGDKAEHTFVWQEEKAPTYTEDGLKKGTCSVCGYEVTEAIAKLPQEESTFVLNTVTKEYDGTVVTFVKGTDYTLPDDYDGTEEIKVYSDAEKTTEVTEMKNAGKYYIVATLTATDKYKAYTSESIEFTVTKAANEWTETPGIAGWVYDGTASAPVGTAKFGDVVFEYAVKGTNNWSTTKPVNAGEYQLRASVAGTNDYTEISKTVDFAISNTANEWTVTPNITGWTYGNTASTPVGTAKYGTVKFEYAVKDTNNWSTTKPVNAGTYQLRASVAGTTDYSEISKTVDFVITKATNEWTTELAIEGWKYGDEPNAPSAVAKFGNGNITYTYKKYDARANTWRVISAPESTSTVGIYQVAATVAETDNYTGLTTTPVTFNITKGTNTWTKSPSIANWMYGNDPSTPVGAARFGEVTFKYGTSTDVSTATETVPTNAGTYYLFAIVAGTGNYEALQSEPYKFEITKRIIKAIKTSKEYDGNAQIHVGADGFELFNNAGTPGVISGDDVSMTFIMETADVGSKMKSRSVLQGTAASNYDLPNYDMFILPQITPRTLNNFDINGSPDGTNSGAAAGQYAGMWYYEHTLETRDTSCLITGDEVKVRIWFANEDDMTDYMNAPEITLVNSMDLVGEGTAYIEIYGGADGNNYQIGDTDLGIYIPGN